MSRPLIIPILFLVSSLPFTGVIGDDIKPKLPEDEMFADLRGLHQAMSKLLEKKGSWPQMPETLRDADEDEFFQFWIDALKPFGATPEMWKYSKHKGKALSSYIPTMFSEEPNQAFRWENQPWFVARGKFDKEAAYFILPDGSVVNSATPKKP